MKNANVILAEHSGFGRISLCGCGAVQLNVGPVTLSLEPAAFLQMVSLVRAATEQLYVMRDAGRSPEGLFEALGSSPNQVTH